MFKNNFFFIILTGYTIRVNSQQTFDEDRFNRIKVFDADGKPFANVNLNIAGSPFLLVAGNMAWLQ